jgi:hypothetical protein
VQAFKGKIATVPLDGRKEINRRRKRDRLRGGSHLFFLEVST